MNIKTAVYKKIISFLSVAVLFLLITNYLALRKLDLATRGVTPVEENFAESVPAIVPGSKEKKIAGKIVLIIDDFGYRDDTISAGFLDLGIAITCAIIPGHEQTRKFAEKASSAGQEVIIHMPMESGIPVPGEEDYKIKTGMTSEEIEWRIREVLKDIPEAVGMNNHQGSKATTDGKVMSVVGSVLKKHGKYFVDSRTSKETVGEKTMRSLGVPTMRRHVFLDNDSDVKKISDQLAQLVQMARKQGKALGIGHARPNTLKVLKKEIPHLLDEGFQFEFASQIVN
ncbi:MAG: divergent polysaccharide deacetylase family protein [Candidatus Marinimicrobia bacterium]|nr:divergent polysaccharide deacetylase family protein [Candidatus Neomarinimicrobiota bacterium]